MKEAPDLCFMTSETCHSPPFWFFTWHKTGFGTRFLSKIRRLVTLSLEQMSVFAFVQRLSTKAGETVAEKIGADLYSWLKQRFEKDQDNDAQAALTQLEKKPDSKPRREALAETLTERAASDPNGFGAELRNHVQQVAATEGNIGTLVGQIIAGNVNVINTMYGNIHM